MRLVRQAMNFDGVSSTRIQVSQADTGIGGDDFGWFSRVVPQDNNWNNNEYIGIIDPK